MSAEDSAIRRSKVVTSGGFSRPTAAAPEALTSQAALAPVPVASLQAMAGASGG